MPLGREGRQRDRLGGFAVDLGILARAPSPAMHHHHVVRLPLCKPRLRRISGLPARRACRSASVLPCVAHPCLERRGHGQHFSGKLDRTARPGRLGAGRRRARPEDCRQGAERALFVDLLARADLPQGCRVVDIQPLLRHLIIVAMDIRQDYPAGGRDERAMELILEELCVLPILALHVPLLVDALLASLCQALRGASLADRSQLYKDVASGPFFGYNQPGARHFSEVRLAQAGSLKAFAGCGLGELVEGDGHGRFRLRVCAQTTPGAQTAELR